MERLRNVKTTPELPRRANLTGFLVKAELRLTPDNKGIGVFAAEFIPANTRVDDPHILYFDEQETLKPLASMPNDDARRHWLEHAFEIKGKVGTYGTNLRDSGMVNHSNDPNLAVNYQDGSMYAIKDINHGEELTEDYAKSEELPFFKNLCEKYGVPDWYYKKDY